MFAIYKGIFFLNPTERENEAKHQSIKMAKDGSFSRVLSRELEAK